MLDRGDPAGRIALAVAQAFDLIDDRNLRIARQDEIAMQRMRQPPFDGAARRHHRLPDHLPAEYPLPARLRAGAAKHVHLDRLEIENGNQVNQAFGHGSAFNLSVRPATTTSHSGARARRESPESITTIGSMDSGPAPRGASRNDDLTEIAARPLLRGPVSPSYNQVA